MKSVEIPAHPVEDAFATKVLKGARADETAEMVVVGLRIEGTGTRLYALDISCAQALARQIETAIDGPPPSRDGEPIRPDPATLRALGILR
jgi:hypothetical protein